MRVHHHISHLLERVVHLAQILDLEIDSGESRVRPGIQARRGSCAGKQRHGDTGAEFEPHGIERNVDGVVLPLEGDPRTALAFPAALAALASRADFPWLRPAFLRQRAGLAIELALVVLEHADHREGIAADGHLAADGDHRFAGLLGAAP